MKKSEWTRSQKVAAQTVTTLLAAADGVARTLEAFFTQYGITGQQYNVLRILRGAGEALPTMEVAERMLQKTPGLTGILDRLERKGLLQRERYVDDRRVWLCSITEQGRALLDEVERPLGAANAEALRTVRTELASLHTLLGARVPGTRVRS